MCSVVALALAVCLGPGRATASLAFPAPLARRAMLRTGPPGTSRTPDALTPDPSVASVPTEDPVLDPVTAASEAWAQGAWPQVRALLEPLASDPAALAPAHVRTRVLLLLADATLSDAPVPDSPADLAERRRIAASYLQRQMDADPAWRMLPDIYTKALFDLYVNVSGERSRDAIDRCRADRMACRSDVKNEQAAYRKLAAAHTKLNAEFEAQEIEVRDRVARSRVFAAIPFGAGHFYNGDVGLGAGFLSLELAAGVSGLGLLLYRVVGDGCRRNRGFQRGSLTCVNGDLKAVERRRKAEEVMAWVFLGSLLLDVAWAQIRFKPVETVRIRRVPRSSLEKSDGKTEPKRPRPAKKKKPRTTVRPDVGGTRHGASLGVSIHF